MSFKVQFYVTKYYFYAVVGYSARLDQAIQWDIVQLFALAVRKNQINIR
jgi:hypothetical protein